MLATCSPVALNREETLSTLRYAASAKNIKTAAAKNEDPMEAKVRQLAEEIAKLKAALEVAENKGGDSGGEGGGGGRGGGGSAGGAGDGSGPVPNAERRDSPHPTALQKGAGIATQDYLDSLNEEEREIYLAELTEHMNVRRLAELVIRYTID
jgi:hypothetical protein